MTPACLSLLHRQHTHTHTHCRVFQPTPYSAALKWTHQNTWKWQSEHQELVSNDIFNHRGFPSKLCLSGVGLFQIAGKDINNIILPQKLGKKLIEEGLVDWDWNSGLFLPSPPVKRSNQPATLTCWEARNFPSKWFIVFKNRSTE